MFERFSRSWQLVKASWSVLQADKELVIFPIMSMIGVIAVMIAFAVPAFAAGLINDAADGNFEILEAAVTFAFLFVMYTVTIFSQTALVGAALIRLDGGDPTVSDGFNIAMKHWPQILGYAAISATVGLLLRMLRERGGLVGMITSWIGEMAWNLATFLVVPVLVVEGVGPLEAINRSTRYLKNTWGEQIVGHFSIGLITGLLGFAVVAVLVALFGGLAVAADSIAIAAVGLGVIILVVMAIALVSSALQGIYVAALYRYATADVIDERYFTPELIEGAFRPK